jgi:murein L,D-transpeptidase YafK
MKRITKGTLILLIALSVIFIAITNISFSTKLPHTADVDSIVVSKQKHTMYVFQHRILLKTYRVALGDPFGAKHFEDDKRTPEGIYFINGKNAGSRFHKSLGISYPSSKDQAYALAAGKNPGGDIKIHGLPNGQWALGNLHYLKDWTTGCIAVTNNEIDELYDHVRVGTVINILP